MIPDETHQGMKDEIGAATPTAPHDDASLLDIRTDKDMCHSSSWIAFISRMAVYAQHNIFCCSMRFASCDL